MLRKPVFWIVFFLVFITSVIFTVRYFSQAFPIVTLDLKMDRQQALQSAAEKAQKLGWGPKEFKQAASFRLEQEVQNFVELEAGGTEAFSKMMEEELYSPYTWQVRHFREGETNETLVRFTPAGSFYGFTEKLPEDEAGPTLPADSAQFIAESSAREISGIDLGNFDLVEKSMELRPGGRTDHSFVYERTDIQIGEGHYRLRLVVGGDRLTELTHFIKIPEAFTRRYEEMRSANRTIASIALLGVAILYILGGCIIGLFFLLRQRWVIWRTALFWGIFIAFLQLLAGINQWPLTWMDYDTALSAQGFFLRQIVLLLAGFVGLSALLTLTFIAAESLSRKAFPHHIQQWKLWSPGVASSPHVLGRTVAGYMLVGIFFAYEVFLYFFSTRILGWWSPSEALFEPDMLATYFPWLSSIAVSAQAGFWEESLFRAIPIAGAALIGQRFGRRKIWIAAAFIIQALIFGAGHANYPNQPAYARLVELIIPSLTFGAVYLSFGLLPAVVLHFTTDVVWFAMPLFVSTAPGIWIDRLLVIILALVPLWIIVHARLRTKHWNELEEEHYNRSWTPPDKKAPEPVTFKAPETAQIPVRTGRFILLGGIVGLIIWFTATNFKNNAPPLPVGKEEAKVLAQKTLASRGFKQTEDWQVLSSLDSLANLDDRFVWRVEGEETYENLMGIYLDPPRWRIRLARFEGDLEERAEEYQMYINSGEKVSRIRHQLPEARPGTSLTKAEAYVYVDFVLIMGFKMNRNNLKEISVVPSKLPERTDWEFTFADTSGTPLTEGEARIVVRIAGDEVVDAYRYIHVPEEWKREDRNERTINSIARVVCNLLLVILLFSGAIAAIVSWSRKTFSVPVFISFFTLLMSIQIIHLINDWPGIAAQFSTSEPLSNQIFTTIALSLLGSIFLSGGFALVAGFLQTWKRSQPRIPALRAFTMGLSLGALIVGLSSLISRITPPLQPVWASYEAVQSYVPLLSAGLSPVTVYISTAITVLFIFITADRFTNGWTHRKSLFLPLLLLIGPVTVGVQGIESIPYWLLYGLFMGAVFLFTYLYVFRFQLSLVPPAVGGLIIFRELKQGIFNAYTGAIPGAALAILCIGLLSYYWHLKLSECDSG